MSQPTPIGKDCFLYYDSPTNWASPSGTLIVDAIDVSMPGITKNMVSLASRGSAGWDPKGPGLKNIDLQFGYLYNAGGDNIFDALMDSYIDDDILIFYVLDGPIAGLADRSVEGFRFPGIVSEAPINQELEDGQKVDFKVDFARYKDSGTLRLPNWYEVAATGGGG